MISMRAADARKMPAYVAAMGVSAEILPLMDSTPAKDMRILFQGEIERLRLASEFAVPLDLIDPDYRLHRGKLGAWQRSMRGG
jgi:hypothetical protein